MNTFIINYYDNIIGVSNRMGINSESKDEALKAFESTRAYLDGAKLLSIIEVGV